MSNDEFKMIEKVKCWISSFIYGPNWVFQLLVFYLTPTSSYAYKCTSSISRWDIRTKPGDAEWALRGEGGDPVWSDTMTRRSTHSHNDMEVYSRVHHDMAVYSQFQPQRADVWPSGGSATSAHWTASRRWLSAVENITMKSPKNNSVSSQINKWTSFNCGKYTPDFFFGLSSWLGGEDSRRLMSISRCSCWHSECTHQFGSMRVN